MQKPRGSSTEVSPSRGFAEVNRGPLLSGSRQFPDSTRLVLPVPGRSRFRVEPRSPRPKPWPAPPGRSPSGRNVRRSVRSLVSRRLGSSSRPMPPPKRWPCPGCPGHSAPVSRSPFPEGSDLPNSPGCHPSSNREGIAVRAPMQPQTPIAFRVLSRVFAKGVDARHRRGFGSRTRGP